MLIELSGGLNGKILDLYSDCSADWILCTGSLGCFPDPNRTDKATRKHGVGEFPELYINQWSAPIPTVFVRGVHEDHRWLAQRARQRSLNVLPNVTWLMDGYETTIGDTDTSCRVLGLGKTYSPLDYNKPRSLTHFTFKEVNRACAAGPVDILLTHDNDEKALKQIIYATRPKLVVHGNSQKFEDYEVMGTRVLCIPNHYSMPVLWDGNKIRVI